MCHASWREVRFALKLSPPYHPYMHHHHTEHLYECTKYTTTRYYTDCWRLRFADRVTGGGVRLSFPDTTKKMRNFAHATQTCADVSWHLREKSWPPLFPSTPPNRWPYPYTSVHIPVQYIGNETPQQCSNKRLQINDLWYHVSCTMYLLIVIWYTLI